MSDAVNAANVQRIQAAVTRRLKEPDDAVQHLPMEALIASARARGEEWAALYNFVQHFDSDTYLFRLDMNLASGFGLCYYSELRPAKEPPFRYTLRTIWLDRATGQPLADLMPRRKVTQHYTSLVELLLAVDNLRRESS